MPSLHLDGPWVATALSGPVPPEIARRSIPAAVPGCIHLDLLAAGLIGEPFDADNESLQQWIGDTVWRFSRTFEWSDDDEARHDLVALGLDTLATVELNGTVVAQTANQHRSYRWNVSHLLTPGENTIEITFDAPVPAAERLEREHGGPLFHVNHHPYNALRKTASNLGWDWGIDVATSGIWRSISIEGWSGARLQAVRPSVDVVGSAGVLEVHVELQHDGAATDEHVVVTVGRDGREVALGSAVVRGSGAVRIAVPDVELWWPRGHGAQPLYDVTVAAAGDAWRRRIGFRTVALDLAGDAHGTPFHLTVNGRIIQVRGANWIPDDAFVTRVDRPRLERRIADATDANMNLLRVWGGGMYESDDFYEICTREGVLVWQDFLLACAAYAEESWLADEIEAEAREAVARLSGHTSHVLWCGNNENLVGYADWGWRQTLDGRTWGERYYAELFPSIVAELAPGTPYIPGSPFSGADLLAPNRQDDGTVHIWDVWNEKDYTAYGQWRPRFAAEFGFQGPPAFTTLFDHVHDQPLHPEGAQLLVHQKAADGNGKLQRGYAPHLPEPRTIDDWHFTTQLNQAHAMRFGISWFRSLAPYNTGSVVWQLNDDWPAISWAAVDSAEHRKPVWYALRDVFAPRFATLQALDGETVVVVLNDTDTAYEGGVTLRRLRFDGIELAARTATVRVAPRGTARIAVDASLLAPADPAEEILVVAFDDGAFARIVHDFADPIAQRLRPDAFTATARSTATGAEITVTASGYLRDLVVLADRADRAARVDDSVLSLLPGERTVLTVSAGRPLDPGSVLDARVLRSANQLLGDAVGAPLPSAGPER
jgi:beta-mannosidase